MTDNQRHSLTRLDPDHYECRNCGAVFEDHLRIDSDGIPEFSMHKVADSRDDLYGGDADA